MKGTYYNLPGIPCNDRITAWGNLDSTQSNQMCTNLNPNKIYNSLYPCAGDPLKGYTKAAKYAGNGTIIKTMRDQTPLSCAKECNSISNCAQFNINNSPVTCQLYNTKSYVQNSNKAKIDSINNNISVFQYNRNIKSDCNEGCKKNDLQNFSQAYQYTVPSQWENGENGLLDQKIGTTLNACKQKCIETPNCNSIVYTKPKRNCKLLEVGKGQSTSKGEDNYTKKSDACNNIFGFSHDVFEKPGYKNYYKGYGPSGEDFGGRVGDYFCKYMKGSNQCVEYKDVTCNTATPSKPKPPVPNPNSGPSACIPPLCDPNTGKPIKKVVKGIQINDFQFQSCQKGLEKGFCLDDIYTYDDLGLPVSQNTSNPPGKNFLYTKDYNIQNGFKILSCPKGLKAYDKNNPRSPISKGPFFGEYICSNDKGDSSCIPYGYPNKGGDYATCPKNSASLYPTTKMKTIEDCIRWCNNNQTCQEFNTTYNQTGNLVCNFYNSTPNGVHVKSIGSSLYYKNSDPYVYSPKGGDKGILKRFNLNGHVNNGYNLSIYKANCDPYGCCADGITPASDEKGTNCKMTPNRVGSPINMFKFTALGGTNTRSIIDDQSGSSYINYTDVPEQFINYTPNKANNYMIKFIIILFIILVVVLLFYKYKI